MVAGLSSDYFVRLGQGRDRNPSVQVLEAVARVLRLDADATAHLVGLAQQRLTGGVHPARQMPSGLLEARGRAELAPPGEPGDQREGDRGPGDQRAGDRELIDGWPRNPAYLQTRYYDCLAANALATALTS